MMTSEHLYRILLRAYPSRYRREFEEPMAQCFRDQRRAADTGAKRVRLWCRTIADLMMTVPIRHLERVIGRADGLSGYSKHAKRAIFFARYEAASFGGPEINLEHLLLGALREDARLAAAVLGREGIGGIRRAIETQQANPRLSPRSFLHLHCEPVNIPLSTDCKGALARAWEQAQASHANVSIRHLLSAILIEDTSEAARLLRHYALDLSSLTRPDER